MCDLGVENKMLCTLEFTTLAEGMFRWLGVLDLIKYNLTS